jgi:hypothetical protein
MGAIPVGIRGTESLAELVQSALSEESHRHVAVTDMEVEGAGPIPAESLMGIEELLDMPAFREVLSEGLDFRMRTSGEEGFEAIIVRFFAAALNQLAAGAGQAAFEGVRALSGREARPVRLKLVWGKLLNGAEQETRVGHGDQQVKGGVLGDLVEQGGGVMLGIGQNQGTR